MYGLLKESKVTCLAACKFRKEKSLFGNPLFSNSKNSISVSLPKLGKFMYNLFVFDNFAMPFLCMLMF
mgnify:FL=1|jgi:hypothetical protein